MRWTRVATGVALLAALLASGRPAAAAVTLVQCGQTINTTGASVVLGNNLDGCPGDGIVIGASNITLDLNGHRLSGSDAANSAGVDNDGGFPNLVVRNGAISDFDFGVRTSGVGSVVSDIVAVANNQVGILTAASDVELARNIAIRNGGDGIRTESADRGRILKNHANRNGDDGVEVTLTDTAVVAGNSVVGNDASGVFLNAVSNVTVGDNKLALNAIDGLIAQLATFNKIQNNRMIGNDLNGIRLHTNATGNTVEGNRTTGSGQNGIVVADSSNVIRDNNASANSAHGIWVTGGMFNKVRGNAADENGVDGIQLNAPTEVNANHVHGNGWLNGIEDSAGWGIDDDAGSTGSGNSSAHNDGFTQCEGSVACQRGPAGPPGILVTCGSPLIKPIRIRNNLQGCTDDGLVVSRDNVDINLAGHRIDGTFGDEGVENSGGHNGTTVRNGVIDNFHTQVRMHTLLGPVKDVAIKGIYAGDEDNFLSPSAIRLEGVVGAQVSGNTLAGEGAGVFVEGDAKNVVIKRNLMTGASGAGGDQGATRILITRNTAAGPHSAFFAGEDASVDVASNRVFGARNDGISIFDSDASAVRDNLLIGSGTGVYVDGDANDVTISGNVIRASENEGISVANGVAPIRIVGNSVTGSDADGILVQNGVSASVRENRSVGNGLDGIDVVSSAAKVSDNIANANGFLSAPGAPENDSGLGIVGNIATQGSGNRAKGNDDPAQCSPDRLC